MPVGVVGTSSGVAEIRNLYRYPVLGGRDPAKVRSELPRMDQMEQDRLLAEALHWEECNSAELNDGAGTSAQTSDFRRYETSVYDIEEDRKFAERLQREEENEYSAFRTEKPVRGDPKHVTAFRALIDKYKGLSLVDRQWETIDPTPDVHAMFQVFDDMFFDGTLRFCTVSWSPRMTSCAGLCCYQAGQCSIRLSRPLLTLRPRSDLVETLLHEMIHAYVILSGKSRSEGRGGHGPEFHKHMYRINNLGKCRITVFHSFHDEVRHYKVHHWRCDGPCQRQHPYFGLVRRSVNRAPSKNDTWWADHQRRCGGTFVKVAGPEMQEGGESKSRKRKAPSGKAAGGDGTGPLSKMLKKTTIDSGASTQQAVSARRKNNVSEPGTSSGNSSNINGSSGISGKTRSDRTTNSPAKPFPSSPPTSFVPFQGTGNRLGSTGISATSYGATGRGPSSAITSGTPQGIGHTLGSTSATTSQAKPTTTQTLRQTRLDQLFSKKPPTASTSNGGTRNKRTPSFAEKVRGQKLINELFSSDDEDPESAAASPKRASTNTRQNVVPIAEDVRHTITHGDAESNGTGNRRVEVSCPVCSTRVPESDINAHLDACLGQ